MKKCFTLTLTPCDLYLFFFFQSWLELTLDAGEMTTTNLVLGIS